MFPESGRGSSEELAPARFSFQDQFPQLCGWKNNSSEEFQAQNPFDRLFRDTPFG